MSEWWGWFLIRQCKINFEAFCGMKMRFRRFNRSHRSHLKYRKLLTFTTIRFNSDKFKPKIATTFFYVYFHGKWCSRYLNSAWIPCYHLIKLMVAVVFSYKSCKSSNILNVTAKSNSFDIKSEWVCVFYALNESETEDNFTKQSFDWSIAYNINQYS